jgi:predicted DNA-binding transcriptional regulator YafY
MNRIDRLHAILTILQSKRVVRAEDIANRFEISLRTVYRDLRALEEGGIPIGAEAGVGYFLTEGFHLPPVMFTHEEARSLLLAGKLIEKQTDESTNKSFLSALTKVRAVLDTDKKDDLEGLDQKIIVNPFPQVRQEEQDLRLNTIKQVLSENRVIQIKYQTSSEESIRVIEALGLCYYGNRWHLIGYCRLRKDYRDFRLDRIQEMDVLQERFLRINHLSLGEYLSKLIKETELVTLKIKVHNSLLKYIQDSKYTMGLVNEIAIGEYTEMTFASYSLDYFSRWILMLGTKVEVVFPNELLEKVKEHTLSLYKLYHK